MLTPKDIDALKQALLPELKQELRAAVEEHAERRWIKGIAKASKISQIHKDELRRLLKEKQIRGYQRPDGTWIIDKNSLDALHENCIDADTATNILVKNKIVDFITHNR